MSREDYLALAQRYQAMAEAAKPAAELSQEDKVEPTAVKISSGRVRNSVPVNHLSDPNGVAEKIGHDSTNTRVPTIISFGVQNVLEVQNAFA
jgi:hypothetical protein